MTFHLTLIYRPRPLTLPLTGMNTLCRVQRACMCGSLRAPVALANHRKSPAMCGAVRWLRTSGLSLRPTESELKVMALLKEKLDPTYLAVEDVSCGCGASFTIHVDSEHFRGKRLIQQHKLVNEALGDEMKSIHSISIRIGTPDTH